MRSYRKLLEVEFTHNYYPSGKLASNDFKIAATPETKKIIENYRLILKLFENKIEIIQECDKKPKSIEAVIEIDEQLKFEFIIGLANKNFFNFTDIRFPAMRKEMFYFSNKKEEKIHKEGNMSKNDTVSKDDIISIKELALSKKQSSSGIIGLLRLYTNEFVNKAIQTKEPFKYSIGFAERKAYWQYNVIEKFNSTKNINIIDEDKKVKFKIEKDNNFDNAKTFISDIKLPITKINKQKLKLISANGKKNFTKTLYEKLPCPTMRDITIHKKMKNEYIAAVNIYI